MYNITDAFDYVNRNRYMVYDVVDMPEESNELIAVRFNTAEEKNIGIINEHGNVINEPFLSDDSDCYCGKYNPPLNKIINYGNYIDLNYYGGGIYNRDMEEVTPSEEERKEWNKYKSSKLENIPIDLKDNAKVTVIDKIYGYFEEPKNFDLRYVRKIGENSDTYIAELEQLDVIKPVGYYLFLDEEYELLSNIYYSSEERYLFVPPSEGSKIGMAFVKDMGMVYFNIDGDIIWISYCDYNGSKLCE